MQLFEAIRRLFASRRGNVVGSFALMLPVIIGAMAFGLEYGNAEYVRNNNQRIADAAAYAGALAFNATASQTDMTNAAKRVGTLNSVPVANVAVALVASPADASRNAVQVTVTERVPLFFSKFFRGLLYGNTTNGLGVVSRSTAELISQTANCILALDRNSTGLQLSGGTNITGTRCGVASNAQLRIANCGPYIQATSASYGTSLNVPTNCGNPPPLRNANNAALTPTSRTAVDPYAASAIVATAAARLTNARNLTAPPAPTFAFQTTGTNISFGNDTNQVGNTNATTCASSTSTACQAWRVGCAATKSGSTWRFNCPAGATANVGTVTISGGIAVSFNAVGSSAATTINFSNTLAGEDRLTFGPGTYTIRGNLIGGYGGIAFNGNALNVTGFLNAGNSGTATFGAGTYNIQAGVFLNGSITATFGAGTFNIGSATIACGGGLYSLCAQTSGGVTFTGPTVMNLTAGLRTGGGATISIGSGSTANSFVFGRSSDGFAFRGDGGSKTVLASSKTGADRVDFGGNVNLTGGGSCLVISEATHHDIRGNLWATGAMWLQPGQYTVLGTINFGGSGGGNTSCNGSTIGLYADGVTLVVGADASVTSTSSGDCAGTSFCLAAGYSSVTLKPQTSGGHAGFAVIGPLSASNTRGGTFTSGAANTIINGVFYMPNGPLTFNGGSRTGDAGGCLEIIGRSINVSAGGLLGSNCLSTGGAQQTRVRVVQ